MKENNLTIRFLYGTKIGRAVLEFVLKTGIDQVAVDFLKSPFSRPFIGMYIKKHRISMHEFKGQKYKSFQEFFARERKPVGVDLNPAHLISPCDGWLSAFPIRKDSSFRIKGFHYQMSDLIHDEELSRKFQGGLCLIFRLAASDYHHYCYIDDGVQRESNYIPGELHSVQAMACEKYPVYILNRRVWTLLETVNFGSVIQTEVGALIVGGIVNEQTNTAFCRGMEKGHFELSGSTIVLMFQKNQISILPHIRKDLVLGKEFRVKQGMWIGMKKESQDRL